MYPKLEKWVKTPPAKLNNLQNAICHLWLNENEGEEWSPMANMATMDYEEILEALRNAEGLMNMSGVKQVVCVKYGEQAFYHKVLNLVRDAIRRLEDK